MSLHAAILSIQFKKPFTLILENLNSIHFDGEKMRYCIGGSWNYYDEKRPMARSFIRGDVRTTITIDPFQVEGTDTDAILEALGDPIKTLELWISGKKLYPIIYPQITP